MQSITATFFDIIRPTILYLVAVEIRRGKSLTSEKGRFAMSVMSDDNSNVLSLSVTFSPFEPCQHEPYNTESPEPDMETEVDLDEKRLGNRDW